jgi:hypothetical protein
MATITKGLGMEIQTTVKDFPAKARKLRLSPNAFIKITFNNFANYGVQKKSRWAKAVERIRSENYLQGRSEEVNKLFRKFRDEFSF